jgi:hypothetical protein
MCNLAGDLIVQLKPTTTPEVFIPSNVELSKLPPGQDELQCMCHRMLHHGYMVKYTRRQVGCEACHRWSMPVAVPSPSARCWFTHDAAV